MGWWFYFQVVGTPHHYMYQSNFFLPQVVGTLKPSIISLCAISPLFRPCFAPCFAPVSPLVSPLFRPLFRPCFAPLFCPLCCSLTSCPSWWWGPYIVAFWWGHYNIDGGKTRGKTGVLVVGTLNSSISVERSKAKFCAQCPRDTSPLYVPIKLFLAAGGGDPKT